MGSFKDKTGRSWVIDITYGSLKRIKLLAGIDILRDFVPKETEMPEDPMTCDVDELPIASRLGFDDEVFINVLFACCARQAEEEGVSDIDFGESLSSEQCSEAREVFLNQLADFFRKKPGAKTAVMIIEQLLEAIEKFRQAENKVMPIMRRKMDQIATQTENKISDEIEKMEADVTTTGGMQGSQLLAESA